MAASIRQMKDRVGLCNYYKLYFAYTDRKTVLTVYDNHARVLNKNKNDMNSPFIQIINR